MGFRISPLWWPVLALISPVLLPNLLLKNSRFKQNFPKVSALNKQRIKHAPKLVLPELTRFEISVLVEQKVENGFVSSPGVSYLLKTDMGALLFDVGFGPESKAFAANGRQMNFSMDSVDGLAISHLHPDHMGGFQAVRENKVILPLGFTPSTPIPCFLPVEATADGFTTQQIEKPGMLAAGIASTGPLARSLFLMGWTEEQALVARIKGKGLVILTGCGHPTIEIILKMVQKLSDEKIYAIGGGLHFPVTDSPFRKPGLKVQMIWGTGKPPWQRINDDDLKKTIDYLNGIGPQHVFLSAHDTCGYAIARFRNELTAQTTVLRAGATYQL